MAHANYELIKKHITSQVGEYGNGKPSLTLALLIPMEETLTLTRKVNGRIDSCVITLKKIELEYELEYAKHVSEGQDCVNLTYDFGDNFDDPDVRELIEDHPVVKFLVSTALMKAGFSGTAAIDLREIDNEIHGVVYYRVPSVCRELLVATSEQVLLWELGAKTAEQLAMTA